MAEPEYGQTGKPEQRILHQFIFDYEWSECNKNVPIRVLDTNIYYEG